MDRGCGGRTGGKRRAAGGGRRAAGERANGRTGGRADGRTGGRADGRTGGRRPRGDPDLHGYNPALPGAAASGISARHGSVSPVAASENEVAARRIIRASDG